MELELYTGMTCDRLRRGDELHFLFWMCEQKKRSLISDKENKKVKISETDSSLHIWFILQDSNVQRLLILDFDSGSLHIATSDRNGLTKHKAMVGTDKAGRYHKKPAATCNKQMLPD